MVLNFEFFTWLKCVTLFMMLFLITQAEGKLSLDDNIGIWLLDEGKGDIAKDSSPNKYDGEITGAKWVKGKIGQALEFKKGNTVTIPLGKGSMRNKASVIMWIQFTDLGGQQNYFSVWDQSSNRLVPYKEGGNMLRCWSNNWNVVSGVTAQKNQWYHIANVYNGKKASIYIDGKLKVSQDVPKFELADQEQTAWLATDKGTGFLSSCVIDEFIFYSRAVTAKEVDEIFTKGIDGALSVDGVGKLPTIWAELKR
ncbi:TPA: hypothetical protein EYN65_21745 [Candidatus Poribacteria bacterium]|nr:hypothetical protein [Candidatus Poribacteria bacterium]